MPALGVCVRACDDAMTLSLAPHLLPADITQGPGGRLLLLPFRHSGNVAAAMLFSQAAG